ncbi:MAG: polysaccharide biosynthesis/export family protein [Planctomycetales bacterium]|nr:polysaccharide biosynthesis/export family protein [Planctomycetales bacterium]
MNRRILFGLVTLILFWGLVGCNNDILDPTQLGRFEPTPTVNVILDTLGVADEPSPTYEGAEDPRPEDLLAYETDYVFGSGDVVRISIFELYQEGQTYVNDYVVTETGRLSIPDVGLVTAAGLTEAQLEREIANILSPSIIKDPSVTATLLNSQGRFFSIIGQGIAQSARYQMPRYPIRLTDAIALAGGMGDFNVSYIYVSRDVKSQDVQPVDTRGGTELKPVEPGVRSPEDEMLDIIAPSVSRKQNGILITTAEMASRQELEALAAPEGIEPLDELTAEPDSPDALLPQQSSKRIEWVFEDGKWKPVEVEGKAIASPLQPELLRPDQYARPEPQPQPKIPSDFGLSDVGDAGTVTRVIQIPRDQLESGDPRYNVIIHPGDRITVPRDLVGEFWVAGNVNAPNAYSITGRPITLKQAIATAGGLNAIAWPQKVEVVRRIGKNKAGLMQEEIVLVDLQKIAQGMQPDFFIKPYDYINVGTHGTSRWLAVLRNAFRATYGFGFIYDRNFADRDYGNDPLPF